jgi:hypothetical protein
MTTRPPLAAIIRDTAPPKPEAPPVTMNVFLLICMNPPATERRILKTGRDQRKVQRAYSQTVPLMLPSPLDLVRARTIGN